VELPITFQGNPSSHIIRYNQVDPEPAGGVLGVNAEGVRLKLLAHLFFKWTVERL
jgi:hypothetical protein